MHACVSLSAVAMVVTGSRSGQDNGYMLVAGTFLSLMSVCMMVYAYRVFVWRATRISERMGGRADDPIGPAVLSGGVLIAMLTCASILVTTGPKYP